MVILEHPIQELVTLNMTWEHIYDLGGYAVIRHSTFIAAVKSSYLYMLRYTDNLVSDFLCVILELSDIRSRMLIDEAGMPRVYALGYSTDHFAIWRGTIGSPLSTRFLRSLCGECADFCRTNLHNGVFMSDFISTKQDVCSMLCQSSRTIITCQSYDCSGKQVEDYFIRRFRSKWQM